MPRLGQTVRRWGLEKWPLLTLRPAGLLFPEADGTSPDKAVVAIAIDGAGFPWKPIGKGNVGLVPRDPSQRAPGSPLEGASQRSFVVLSRKPLTPSPESAGSTSA